MAPKITITTSTQLLIPLKCWAGLYLMGWLYGTACVLNGIAGSFYVLVGSIKLGLTWGNV